MVSRVQNCKPININAIIFLHFIIILFVGKCKCQHALFFQVGFMNSGKASYKYCTYAKMTRFHGRMFP